MVPGIEFAQKLARSYSSVCKPLCHRLNLPQTAFDILMFLGNNPEYQTARDIVEIRHIKANLVSVNVERLVQEGYLTRSPAPGDRRKTLLLCTEKAQDIISQGRQLQENYFASLFQGVDQAHLQAYEETTRMIEENLNHILEGENLK